MYMPGETVQFRMTNVTSENVSITLCPITLLRRESDGSWSLQGDDPAATLCSPSTVTVEPHDTIDASYVLRSSLAEGTYRVILRPIAPVTLPILNYDAWFSTPSFAVSRPHLAGAESAN
jgi:hypothetical protein